MKASGAVKTWNRQAREVARPGVCCAIRAWCEVHK